MTDGLTHEEKLDNQRLVAAFGVCLKERQRLHAALEWIAAKARRTGQPQIAFVAEQALSGEDPNPLRRTK